MPQLDGFTTGTYSNLDSSEIEDGKRWLVISPYVAHAHLLNLATITEPQRLFAKALTVMKPIPSDYATASYQESFNWSEIICTLKDLITATGLYWAQQSFYVVVFRSQVLASTDRARLAALDERSHAEAMKSGGLLKYWFGIPDGGYRNLATCIWNTGEDAKRGGRGEGHREAARATNKLYSEWRVERLRFDIGENAERWSIRDWDN